MPSTTIPDYLSRCDPNSPIPLNWGGEVTIIAAIDKVKEALEGITGTKITKNLE